MRTRIVLTLLSAAATVAFLSPATSAAGQEEATGAVQEKTKELLAQMNRTEHKVREVMGRRVEKYREIRSEPVLKKSVREYAGDYEVPGRGYTLTLKINENGSIQGSGSELQKQPGRAARTAPSRGFTLRNTQITGALLTATKVYDDGETQPMEGVFITRTDRDSPTEPGRSSFGLGVIRHALTAADTSVTKSDRLFYQFKR